MHNSGDVSIDGERLARYVSGESTAEERAEIEAWIATDPSRRQLLASLTEVWALTEASETSWDVDAAWRAFAERRSTLSPAASGTRVSVLTGRRRAAVWPLRAAAAVALIVGGAVVWNQLLDSAPYADSVAMQEFTTGPGERIDAALADGSIVTLAPQSRLRIVARFGDGAREVQLDGQALFQVSHDRRRPFRVLTGGAVTEVLGTRFVVRAYVDDDETSVALAEGSVRLRAPDDEDGARAITLRPGQVARAASGAVSIDADESVTRFLSWTEGRLVFEDTPLGEAVRDLSRWYEVNIRLTDAGLAERRLTASFRGEAIDQVIDLIALSLNLRYERNGREIVFSAR